MDGEGVKRALKCRCKRFTEARSSKVVWVMGVDLGHGKRKKLCYKYKSWKGFKLKSGMI